MTGRNLRARVRHLEKQLEAQQPYTPPIVLWSLLDRSVADPEVWETVEVLAWHGAARFSFKTEAEAEAFFAERHD